jgi:hypothetical protein
VYEREREREKERGKEVLYHACAVELENVFLLWASFELTYPKSSLGYATAINADREAMRCKTLNYYWPRCGVISV